MTHRNEIILFSNRTKVRCDDLSYGNHLCHTKLVNITHNSRALFLRTHELSEIDCFGTALIILKLNVEYINQCFFDDCLETSIYLEGLERTTIKLSYSTFNITTGKLAGKATTLSGFFDRTKNKITKVPLSFKNLIDSFTHSTPSTCQDL